VSIQTYETSMESKNSALLLTPSLEATHEAQQRPPEALKR